MKNTMNMTTGSPLRLLFTFALPLMFGNIFQQLYTVVDTAIVGQGVGMAALAALGSVDWLNWMFLGIAQGFTQGFCVRIAQKYGQKDETGLKQMVAGSMILSVLLSVVGTAAGQIFLPQFLMILKVPQELKAMATLYARIILGSFPAMIFFNLCSSCLRAVGDSKTPLYAMITAALTNIALDCLAVFVLDWGIAGAAAATVFSQCLSGFICARKIVKTPLLRFDKSHIRPGCRCIPQLLRIGAPIAGKNIVISLGGMYVQSVVNGFTMSFIAGFTATNKLYGVLEIAAISYGYAVTTFVGQNYGAGQMQRIKKGMKSAVLLSICTAIVISGLMFLFGRNITMLFISKEVAHLAVEAGNTAYQYLCAMSIMLPALYLLYAYQAALQGIGNASASMKSGIIELIFRVSLSTLVAYTGFQEGLFIAEVSAWSSAALYLALQYYYDIRKISKKELPYE